MARILNREIYMVNFASVVDSKLGQTQKNLAELFDEINGFVQPDKVIVLFDEIDAIALDRTNANDHREMGILTAVFGGIVRDMMCVDVPLIFKKKIYATACFVGGCIYLLLDFVGCPEFVTIVASSLVIFVVRTISVLKNWSLPKFR